MKCKILIIFISIFLLSFYYNKPVYPIDYHINVVNSSFKVIDFIPFEKFQNANYFNIKDIIEIFDIKYLWEPLTGILRLTDTDNDFKLKINNKIALYNNKLLTIENPPLLKESKLLISENILKLFTGSIKIINNNDRYYLQKVKTHDSNTQSKIRDTIANTILKYSDIKFPDLKNKTSLRSRLKTIIIDPGHGGNDPGAIGYSKTKEKDITLSIAKLIHSLLKQKAPDLTVLLTRTDDRYLSLDERTIIANKNKGDLFVSIHCNAGYKTASGFETYYFSLTESDESERTVRLLENSANKTKSKRNNKSIVDFITTDLAQLDYIRESVIIAKYIQKNLGFKLQTVNRGLKKARFFILKDAFMPSVLIETGFITNKYEEKLLTSELFQKKIATAVVNAILSFKKEFDSTNGFRN